MKVISVYVSEKTYTEFKKYAQDQDRPVAELIREAMGSYRDSRIQPPMSLKRMPTSAKPRLKRLDTRTDSGGVARVICGVDANVLIYSAIESMPEHPKVLSFFERRVLTGELTCAVTFTVLLEFMTTDPQRFRPPLTSKESLSIAEQYWNASDWRRLLPQPGTGTRTLDLFRRHRLGRKRLLDTYFAATLLDNGVSTLITCNSVDFGV